MTRFDMKLSFEQKELFERAKTLGGYKSLSDFVLSVTQKRADEIINEHEILIEAKENNEIFIKTLLSEGS